MGFELKIWALGSFSKKITLLFLLQTANEAVLYLVSKSCFQSQNPESNNQFCALALLQTMTSTTNTNKIHFLIQHIASRFGCEHHSKKGTVPLCGTESTTDIFSNLVFLLGNFLWEYRLILFPTHWCSWDYKWTIGKTVRYTDDFSGFCTLHG